MVQTYLFASFERAKQLSYIRNIAVSEVILLITLCIDKACVSDFKRYVPHEQFSTFIPFKSQQWPTSIFS